MRATHDRLGKQVVRDGSHSHGIGISSKRKWWNVAESLDSSLALRSEIVICDGIANE